MQASSFETLPYVCAKLRMFARLWGKLYYSNIIYMCMYTMYIYVCVCVCVYLILDWNHTDVLPNDLTGCLVK